MQWEEIEAAQVAVGQGFFGGTTHLRVRISRARVPGGWLVLAVTTTGPGTPVAITFYPDPSHSWEAEAPRRD